MVPRAIEEITLAYFYRVLPLFSVNPITLSFSSPVRRGSAAFGRERFSDGEHRSGKFLPKFGSLRKFPRFGRRRFARILQWPSGGV